MSQFSVAEDTPLLDTATAATVLRIEAFIEEVITRIVSGGDPCGAAAGVLPGLCATTSKPSKGSTARPATGGFTGARDLASMLRVLSTCYEMLLKKKSLHKRQMYYLHKTAFAHENEAHAAIEKVSQLLGVSSQELGIFAAGRGWYDGLVLERAPDISAAAAAIGGGAQSLVGSRRPIRPDVSLRPANLQNLGARFILVVEKECIFSRLCEDRIWEKMPCIIITGCGMPDLATRAFLHQLHSELDLPAFGLFDLNPHGIGIMTCYRFGSKSRPEANVHCVPLTWLGLRWVDVDEYDIPSQALQAMTPRDEAKAKSLLAHPLVSGVPSLVDDLEESLERRKKLELEAALQLGVEFLACTYLPDRMRSFDEVFVTPVSVGSQVISTGLSKAYDPFE